MRRMLGDTAPQLSAGCAAVGCSHRRQFSQGRLWGTKEVFEALTETTVEEKIGVVQVSW